MGASQNSLLAKRQNCDGPNTGWPTWGLYRGFKWQNCCGISTFQIYFMPLLSLNSFRSAAVDPERGYTRTLSVMLPGTDLCCVFRLLSDHHLAQRVQETFLNVTEVGNECGRRNSFHRNYASQSPHGAMTCRDRVRV